MTPGERDKMTAALKRFRRETAGRDPLVVAALDLGFSKEEVHQLTGLGRSTIDRITGRQRQRQDPSSEERQ